jgi:hypothetical protein
MQKYISPSFVPLHADFSYRVDYVGLERQPVLVIDNFLAHAETLVDFAQQGKFNTADAFYPGVRLPAPELYLYSFQQHLHSLVRDTFGLRDEWVTGVKADFSMVTTPPAQLHPAQCLPHFDSANSRELAAVHYLCDSTQGGTSLYRHKPTNYETIDVARKPAYRNSLKQALPDHLVPRAYMNGSNDFFEQIASYDACFNRLIIYRCNNLHSGNIAPDFIFDPSPRTGRLTLNTFIYART